LRSVQEGYIYRFWGYFFVFGFIKKEKAGEGKSRKFSPNPEIFGGGDGGWSWDKDQVQSMNREKKGGGTKKGDFYLCEWLT